MEPKRPLYAIFEGGGAKGIAHIGAVKAIEELNFTFAGVAGASAGAFVAALVAVGYRSEEIFSKTSRDHNLLSRHGKTPSSLLGRWRWFGFKVVRRPIWAALGLSVCTLALALAGWGAGVPMVKVSGVCAIAALSFFIFLTACVAPAWCRRGWFDTRQVQEFVNAALKAKLTHIYSESGSEGERFTDDRVLFRHLDEAKFPGIICPLKIIATDVDEARLVLFDSYYTPDVEVAAAVASSIAIPFVFQPCSAAYAPGKEANRLADGGMVSNLPVWAFASEKLAWERANPDEGRIPVVAFRLENPQSPDLPTLASTGFAYAKSVARSAIFGGQDIANRFLDDVHTVALRPDVGVLEFGASRIKVCNAIDVGRNETHRMLRDAFDLYPKRAKDALRNYALRAEGRLNNLRREAGRPDVGPLRASIFEPFERHSLRVTHAWNMEGDADDRLVLDHRGPGAAAAFKGASGVTINFGRADRASKTDFMTKYDRALLPGDLRFAFCMPIFGDVDEWGKQPADRSRPKGVVCLDSEDDLADCLEDPELSGFLRTAAVELSAVINGGHPV